MVAIAFGVGVFLAICGALFVLSVLLPRLGVLAAVRSRLELTGVFERSAALVSGVLFLASGGALTLGVEHLR